MSEIKSTKSTQGELVEWVDEVKGSGAMKDFFFSPDKTYGVAFFKDKLTQAGRERLEAIVGVYKEKIFDVEGGDYWKQILCWPYDIVEHEGRVGVVLPVFSSNFFFDHGSVKDDFLGIKGAEKNGKWFSSAKNQNKLLDERERGDLLSYLRIGILLSRGVKRLHAAGLAHSDLSYNNVLIDPAGRSACIVDIDGLVVPGKFPPDVVGTPDFIAPEVMQTRCLSIDDPQRVLPSILTDRHALSVLIYMYLLFRHPLKGGKIHDLNPAIDDELAMGRNALFIEDPSDDSNRPNPDEFHPNELPFVDVNSMPYSILGPYLQTLFDRAFIDGLKNPNKRPTADDWEVALVKTVDLLQPCPNASCSHKWFVFDNTLAPKCPYCGTPYTEALPVLNLYSARANDKFMPDNHRLMVYHNQYIYQWHANRLIFPNERLSAEERKPVAYFVKHKGEWYLVNQNLPHLYNVKEKKDIPIGKHVLLADGLQLIMDIKNGGRLALVQMVNA